MSQSYNVTEPDPPSYDEVSGPRSVPLPDTVEPQCPPRPPINPIWACLCCGLCIIILLISLLAITIPQGAAPTLAPTPAPGVASPTLAPTLAPMSAPTLTPAPVRAPTPAPVRAPTPVPTSAPTLRALELRESQFIVDNGLDLSSSSWVIDGNRHQLIHGDLVSTRFPCIARFAPNLKSITFVDQVFHQFSPTIDACFEVFRQTSMCIPNLIELKFIRSGQKCWFANDNRSPTWSYISRFTELMSLTFRENEAFRNRDMDKIADLIRSDMPLEVLTLQNQGIEDSGVLTLIHSLAATKTLRELYLDNPSTTSPYQNDISDSMQVEARNACNLHEILCRF